MKKLKISYLKLLTTLCLMILFGGIITRVSLAQTSTSSATPSISSGAPVGLFLDPASSNFIITQQYPVNVVLRASTNSINSVYFRINFDKDKLQLISFNPITDNGLAVISTPFSNSEGYIEFKGTRAFNSNRIISGDVTLGTLRFKAKVVGTANVRVASLKAGTVDIPILPTVAPPAPPLSDGVYTIDTAVSVTKVRVAESPDGLNSPRGPNNSRGYIEFDYDSTPTQVQYTFGDKTAGLKTLYACFVDNKGGCQRVPPLAVTYAPEPKIDSISCNYDTAGTGTVVLIKGFNFGSHSQQGGGNVNINGRAVSVKPADWGLLDTQQGDSAIQSPSPTSSSTAASPTVPVTISPTSASQSTGSGTTNSSTTSGIVNLLAGQSSSDVLAVSVTGRTKIIARINDKPEGDIPIVLALDDGQQATGQCTINTTTVSVNAKIQCRPPENYAADNVSISLFEATAGAKPATYKVSLTADGTVQGFAPKLQVGKDYALQIKAPKTLSVVKRFTAEEGTTVLNDINLPVGRLINTSDHNLINSLDVSQLRKEWVIGTDASRNSDFNMDGRVNSLDYACLRDNYNRSDDVYTPPSR